MMFFASTLTASPTSRLAGVVTGLMIAKPILHAGTVAVSTLTDAVNFSEKNQTLAKAAGGVSAAAAFVMLLGASPFETGIKIALVMGSTFQGMFAAEVCIRGDSHDVTLDIREGIRTLIIAISAIWIGIATATLLHPAIGCYLGALTASVINYGAICLVDYFSPEL